MEISKRTLHHVQDLCPVCEGDDIELFLENKWDKSKDDLSDLGLEYFPPKWSFCSNCSHVFLNPRFSNAFEARLYGEDSLYRNISFHGQSEFEYMMSIDNTVDGSSKVHKTHSELFKKILKLIDIDEVNFLDFGAGWGSSATAAESNNIFYKGVELDNWCLKQAVKLSRNVKSSFDNYENIDLLYSHQVFEHINNPREVIEQFIHKMKIGSYIFTNVPTYEFDLTKNWGSGGLDALNWFHCQSYSRKSLTYLFELYGFEVVKSWLGEGDVNVLMRKKTNAITEPKKMNQSSLRKNKIELMFHRYFLVYVNSIYRLIKTIIKKLLNFLV